MAITEAIATIVVDKRTNKRCWLLNSSKKRYSLAAKTNTHSKKMIVYFIFIKMYAWLSFFQK